MLPAPSIAEAPTPSTPTGTPVGATKVKVLSPSTKPAFIIGSGSMPKAA